MSQASTHTEIYRPFEGELRRHPLRFLTISLSSIRLAFKKKLPALLLYIPPGIGTIVFGFIVHLKYRLQSGELGNFGPEAAAVGAVAGRNLQVAQQIVNFSSFTQFFALLAIGWYGSGLIADDRRLGAHLLYFSRPITRIDYFLGKFTATAFYGACAVFVPILLICSVAAFSSPDWSFVKEQGDVIWKSMLYSLLLIITITSLVLAVSSLVDRKTHALAGTFGVFFLSESVGRVLTALTDEPRWELLRVTQNFAKIAAWTFDLRDPYEWDVSSSFAALGALLALCFFIIASRLKRMEIVA